MAFALRRAGSAYAEEGTGVECGVEPHTRHPTPDMKRSQTKPENSSGLLLSLINDFYLPGNPYEWMVCD